jgi:hypothetical protein
VDLIGDVEAFPLHQLRPAPVDEGG